MLSVIAMDRFLRSMQIVIENFTPSNQCSRLLHNLLLPVQSYLTVFESECNSTVEDQCLRQGHSRRHPILMSCLNLMGLANPSQASNT